MRKRLRKKLHRDEFQEYGFTVSWQFDPPLDAEDLDMFFKALIASVEGRNLTFGGGGGLEQGSGFICKKGCGSVSEEDRSTVADWFEALKPRVSTIVGPCEDAWHSPRPELTIIRDWIRQGASGIIIPPSKR